MSAAQSRGPRITAEVRARTPAGRRRSWSRRHRTVFNFVALGVSAVLGWLGYEHWTELEDPSRTHVVPLSEVPAAAPGQAYVRCMVLGDTGTGHEGQREVARAMLRRHEKDAADFLLLLGDNFYHSGVESVDDPQWDEKVFDPYAGLGIPIRAILGNHDHNGRWQAQIDRTAVDPRWIMPAAYYTFSGALSAAATVEFFALDTQQFFGDEEKGEDQLDWLDRALVKSNAVWKVVVGHHPVYSNSGHGTKTLKRRLEPILVRNDVDLYICGHDHCLQILSPKDGVVYVISGGGAASDNPDEVRWAEDTLYAATQGGFAALRIGVDEVVIEMVRPDGETGFVTLLHRP